MRILMLGWEYPPHISGGLGVACKGLTTALAEINTSVTFVIPRVYGDEHADHMQLMGTTVVHEDGSETDIVNEITTIGVPAFLQPYWSPEDFSRAKEALALQRADAVSRQQQGETVKRQVHYGSDIFEEVARFTQRVLTLASQLQFDIIHAHDWMTFSAGVSLKNITGKPLIVHVHSLERDRSGEGGNERIQSFERLGMENADAVVSVSSYTAELIAQEYRVPMDKLHVIHNGLYQQSRVNREKSRLAGGKKIVLFLGRVTRQKGPDYFVEAAARVLSVDPDILFIMAGSGDMLPRLQERVRELGIEDSFSFPGFLNDREVEDMFAAADLYIMPSVSEPFGIAALEAINQNTPALISRQSGVREVVKHALSFDFWDIDRLADLILNSLLYDELRYDMVHMARQEVARLRWSVSAEKTKQLYGQLL